MVRIVEVPVRVEDAAGRFVPDLTAQDFELVDEAEPRAIDRVSVVSGPRQLSGPAVMPATPTAAVVLAIDDAHTDPAAFARLKSGAAAFLQRLPPADLAGVFVGGQLVGGRLSTDRGGLLDGVRAANPPQAAARWQREAAEWPRITGEDEAVLLARGNGAALDQAGRRACADDPDACRRDGGSNARLEVQAKARRLVAERRQTSRESLTAWRALARGLRAAPGSKAIVVFTGGFGAQDELGAMRAIVEDAARSDVTFYFVDALGTGRNARSADVREQLAQMPGELPLSGAGVGTAEDVMSAIASETGGFVVRGVNDVAAALDRVARDRAAYYVLAFTPPETPDDRWRRLRVTVRRSGLSVRARRGYWALRSLPDPTNDPATTSAPASAPAPASASAFAAAPAADLPAPPVLENVRPLEVTDTSGLVAVRPDAPTQVAALANRVTAGPATADSDGAARDGWNAYQRGDLDGAADRLSAAVRAGSPRPWVWYALGFAEMARGRPRESAEAWERVRASVPEFKPVYFDLADAFLRQRRSADALRVLEDADRRWPGDVDVLNALGAIHVGRGSIDAGITWFERALAANADDAMTHFNLGKSFELRYVRSARFVRATRQWYRDAKARERAAVHYERHIALGGTLAAEARDGLRRLEWAPR